MSRASTIDTMSSSTMEELQDTLHAMRRQEAHYQCCDYTQPAPLPQHLSLSSSSSSPSREDDCEEDQAARLHLLLQECASLVTDPCVAAPQTHNNSTSSQSSSSNNNSSSHKSPPRANKTMGPTPKSPSSVLDPISTKDEQEEDCQTQVSAATTAAMTSSPSWSSLQQPPSLQSQDESTEPQERFRQCVPPDLAYWRLQMFDWACMVVDGFHMDRCAILGTAFNLLDRYTLHELERLAATSHARSAVLLLRDDYQLFAMTALYVSVKVLEPYPRKMSLETLVTMSRDFYTAEDIAATELEMLTVLQYRTTPPTAVLFGRALEPLVWNKNNNSHYAQQQQQDLEQVYSTICDVTVSDPSFLEAPTSLVGLAALLHAARLTGHSRRARAQLQRQGLACLGLEEAQHHAQLVDLYQRLESLYC